MITIGEATQRLEIGQDRLPPTLDQPRVPDYAEEPEEKSVQRCDHEQGRDALAGQAAVQVQRDAGDERGQRPQRRAQLEDALRARGGARVGSLRARLR